MNQQLTDYLSHAKPAELTAYLRAVTKLIAKTLGIRVKNSEQYRRIQIK
jgi:hypothetical protein